VTVAEGANADLWVFDAERGTNSRLTYGGFNNYAVWHPDGRSLVFQSRNALYSVRADGAERPQVLLEWENVLQPMSFTPDGRRLMFSEQRLDRGALHTVAIEENAGRLQLGPPELFLEIPAGPGDAAFSPDGRWIAYASSESGAYEVYVRAFPDDGQLELASSGGGNLPKWSRTANELFYRTEDQLLMVTSYDIVDGTFVAARPRVWSQRRLFNSGLTPNFDVAPDGRRFVVQIAAEEPGSQETHPVMLQVNFLEEVRRRVARDSE
jgi:serine/threonine-protein kinase